MPLIPATPACWRAIMGVAMAFLSALTVTVSLTPPAIPSTPATCGGGGVRGIAGLVGLGG